MNLLLVGLDHTSASVAVRECLAFSATALPEALSQLAGQNNGHQPLLTEAVIISTCNRVEVYGVFDGESDEAAQKEVAQKIVNFLAAFHQTPADQFASSLFFRFDEEVVTHLFETAAGLRSIVLGEAQIQGQVRKAYDTAQRVRTTGPILSRLFHHALATGKRVRHETLLGTGAASVSQAGVELARQRLGTLEGRCVLLVGSGQVSELAAQNLLANGAENLLVVNRTYENGQELAARYGARALTFDELPYAMGLADIVISSTAAPTTVIQRAHVEAAMQAKLARGETAPEMLLIDLAVPRDIETDVGTVAGAYLATVDDLQSVVNKTLEHRNAVVTVAKRIVSNEVHDFGAWLRIHQTLPTLSTWRQHAEELRDSELKRAMRRLSTLSPEEQYVVEALSRSLVNKLLHFPTLRTKSAAALGDGQRYAEMLRELWEI